jgi:FAD:protein FMN transferase
MARSAPGYAAAERLIASRLDDCQFGGAGRGCSVVRTRRGAAFRRARESGRDAAHHDQDLLMPTFRAMNTDVTVLIPGVDAAREADLTYAVGHVFAEAEHTFSRFQSTSELSRLNQAGGPSVVSAKLFDALERARGYWEMTGGRFDPTIGQALRAAGYDRSFAPGVLDRAERRPAPSSRASFGDVRLDRTTRTVTLPADTLLDFGGFIKGWTVDVATALLPSVAAIDAGGDGFLSGPGSDGRGWIVDVEDPFAHGRALLTLRLRDQAVATSGANRRKWRTGDGVAHHIIHPHTSEPARTDLAQVTVVCHSAELGDVLAKTAFLMGYAEGSRFLAAFSSTGTVFVLHDGAVRLVGELEVDEHG